LTKGKKAFNYPFFSSNRKTEQWKQQEANQYATNRIAIHTTVPSACLEGKGYKVK
jgi:hypothetical protein